MLKNISVLLLLPVAILSCALNSCTREPVHLYEYDTICFQEDVLPLLQTSCGTSGCHDEQTATEGFVATNYESVVKMITPGDAQSSVLYKVITAINSDDMMPPEQPLTYQQRTMIRIWIEQGAMNTRCFPEDDTTTIPVDTIPEPVDTTSPPPPPCFEDSVSFSNDVWPIINANCVGCHNASRLRGGINLEGYDNIVDVANMQQDGFSLLYGVIERLPGFSAMPRSAAKLDTCSVKIIKLWIEEGAKNN